MSYSEETKITVLSDEALLRLFEYLDKKTLLSARQVNHQWNKIALTLFPQRISISCYRIRDETTTSAMDLLKDFNPKIFRRIVCSNINPGQYRNTKNFLIKYLSCLKQLNATHYINFIHVAGSAELESLVPIVNFHGLPNLSTIKLSYGVSCGNYHFTTEFLPNALPSLKELEQFVWGLSPPATPSFQRFMQSLINASLNLESLEVHSYYDLKEHDQMLHLKLCSLPEDGEALHEMISDVAGSLTSLTIEKLSFGTALPQLPKLRKLEILHSKQITSAFSNISVAAPNIRILKTSTLDSETEDPSVSQYLLLKPSNLEMLTVACCVYGRHPSEMHNYCKEICSSFVAYPKKSKILKVEVGCCYWFISPLDFDVLQFLVNLDVPNLIIEYPERHKNSSRWISGFIKRVCGLEVLSKPERNGRLEIGCSQQKLTNQKFEDDILREFPKAMVKLMQRWDRIILKNVNIPTEQVEIMKKEIVANNLRVDLCYAFGK